MTGFEPRTSSVGSDRCVNKAITAAQALPSLYTH